MSTPARILVAVLACASVALSGCDRDPVARRRKEAARTIVRNYDLPGRPEVTALCLQLAQDPAGVPQDQQQPCADAALDDLRQLVGKGSWDAALAAVRDARTLGADLAAVGAAERVVVVEKALVAVNDAAAAGLAAAQANDAARAQASLEACGAAVATAADAHADEARLAAARDRCAAVATALAPPVPGDAAAATAAAPAPAKPVALARPAPKAAVAHCDAVLTDGRPDVLRCVKRRCRRGDGARAYDACRDGCAEAAGPVFRQCYEESKGEEG